MVVSRRLRLRGHSLNRLIPNMLTVAALSAGLSAVRYGLLERWEVAVGLVVVAALLDTLDGRIARMIGGTSKFGAELDSLSDVICFGVVPALLLYLWSLDAAGGLGFSLSLMFAVCCALRLARFNTMLGESPLPASYFQGVPAPAAAGLALLPMMLSFQFGRGFFDLPAVVGAVVVGVALLMVSNLPTFSFKKVRVPHRFVLPTLLMVGVVAAGLVAELWTTLTLALVAYAISIPFSVRRGWRRQRLVAAAAPSADTTGPGSAADTDTDAAPAAEENAENKVISIDHKG